MPLGLTNLSSIIGMPVTFAQHPSGWKPLEMLRDPGSAQLTISLREGTPISLRASRKTKGANGGRGLVIPRRWTCRELGVRLLAGQNGPAEA